MIDARRVDFDIDSVDLLAEDLQAEEVLNPHQASLRRQELIQFFASHT